MRKWPLKRYWKLAPCGTRVPTLEFGTYLIGHEDYETTVFLTPFDEPIETILAGNKIVYGTEDDIENDGWETD